MDRVRKQLHLDELYHMGLTGRDVNVCVLDTGLFMHRDFTGRVVEFIDFTERGRKGPYDDSGHGTHVCGILAGSGYAAGGQFMGVAPEAGIIAGKILDREGKGSVEELFSAMDWILSNQRSYQIHLVNISIGIPEKDDFMESKEKRKRLRRYIELLYERGILLVTAAGNFGPENNSLSLLGESTHTICVGCHDGAAKFGNIKKCENYSGRGPSVYSLRKPDLVAPGTQIISCSNRHPAGYVRKSGTSMSCPIVSGLAALLLQRYPGISVEELMQKLRKGTTDLGEPWTKQGYGMIDGAKVFGF